MEKYYTQHEGRVINTDTSFTHVMAIALDPRSQYLDGVIRCIKSREGDLTVAGYIDRSELRRVKGTSLEQFEIGEKISIQGEVELINKITHPGYEFIGLEDPDIWIDESTDELHLYFTLPLVHAVPGKGHPHLGHAVGKSLNSLVMTEPVLFADSHSGAKELSIAPMNSQGFRYNLVESSKKEPDFTYSVVRVALAKDMRADWQFGDIIFHPKEQGIPWIGGHASPGPLFSKKFIEVGEGKVLGIMNGREANKRVGHKITYGMFSVGLFIYDYEVGKIDWVSPEPLIADSEATTITFASQFVETQPGEGILYAHVDDSFVRAYTVKAEELKAFIKHFG
jgi:hypothetical protein